jgi:hypothetical protein
MQKIPTKKPTPLPPIKKQSNSLLLLLLLLPLFFFPPNGNLCVSVSVSLFPPSGSQSLSLSLSLKHNRKRHKLGSLGKWVKRGFLHRKQMEKGKWVYKRQEEEEEEEASKQWGELNNPPRTAIMWKHATAKLPTTTTKTHTNKTLTSLLKTHMVWMMDEIHPCVAISDWSTSCVLFFFFFFFLFFSFLCGDQSFRPPHSSSVLLLPHPHHHSVVLFWMNLYLTQPLPIWWRGGSWMDENFFSGLGRGERDEINHE